MNMYEAVIAAAAVSRSQVRRSYLRAVAGGVHNTHCSPAEERRCGALKLLALATLRLPDLVLYVHLMHVYHDDGHEDEDESDDGAADVVTRAVGDIAAGGCGSLIARSSGTAAIWAIRPARGWIVRSSTPRASSRTAWRTARSARFRSVSSRSVARRSRSRARLQRPLLIRCAYPRRSPRVSATCSPCT